MSLVFLFRKLVFAQVLMGIVSFCMAEQNPGMLLVAGALGAMSWYVTEGPTGRPLPKWLINLGSLAAVAWLILDLYRNTGVPGQVLLAMGHFTMWLQVLLLYANKSNRDYGQLLVLSLLQMIGASVLSVSIMYGLLLLIYCVLTLFTVLVFHLKSTSDAVMDRNQSAAPLGLRVPRAKIIFGRGHRWQFRTMAGAVGIGCGLLAAGVFIVLPRTSRYESPPEFASPLTPRQVGFSNQVRLDAGSPLGGGREPVLSLAVSQGGRSIGSDDLPWLLRGASLDSYDVRERTWSRGPVRDRDVTLSIPAQGATLAPTPEGTPMIDAVITLRSTSERTLFTLHPVTRISSLSLGSVDFNAVDQQLSLLRVSTSAVVYQLRSPVDPPAGLFEQYRRLLPAGAPGEWRRFGEQRPGLMLDPDTQYARDWPVTMKGPIQRLTLEILQRAGLTRDPEALEDPHDAAIAQALTHHLRTNYEYALVNPPRAGQEDPIVDFLFRSRRGHCELFASALAAMCRSIGMGARVITGFRASEFNRIGGYYVVRESNAHAWTEVWCGPRGWKAFDSTPPLSVQRAHHVERSWHTSIRELYEHLEFAWISSVIAYDKETRQAVFQEINRSVRDATIDPESWLGAALVWFRELFEGERFTVFTYGLIVFICVFILIGLASLARTLVLRRRRLVALQLMKLPRAQRRGLARRLRFYLQMLDMLERHGYHRPAWQSPAGFAQQLASSDPMRFDPVVSLTEHFYEVRFGYRDLDEPRLKIIRAHLQRLQHVLLQGA